MLRAGAALGAAVDEMGAGRQVARYQLQVRWAEFVGPQLARNSQPQRLSGSVLWVTTSTPAWSQEIALRQNQILDDLDRAFPRLRLHSIRCRVGTLRGLMLEENDAREPDLRNIQLTPAAEARAKALAEGIEDPDLRRAAWRALRQRERRNQWLRQQGAQACLECGSLQEWRLCLGCRQERARQLRQELFQLLGREPWCTLQEAQQRLPGVTQNLFHTARRQLLSIQRIHYYQLRDGLKEGDRLPTGLRQIMLEICMLATATPWDQLQERHIRFGLGRTWAIAYRDNRAPAPYVDKNRATRASTTS